MMKLRLFLAALLLPLLCYGQSVPNGGTITQGQVWTAPQWIAAWQSKADVNSPAVFPQTPAELAASVTPTSTAYLPGNLIRYGADPTGIASSAAALTSAAASNSVVMIPPGVYLIPCGNYYSFTNAVSLVGAGEGVTTIRFASGCSQTTDYFKWNGLSGVAVEGLTIDLNSPATPGSRQNILGFYAYAANATHLLVDHVEIKNAVSPILLVSVAAAGGNSYSDVRIQNNTLSLATAATSQNQCIALTTVNAAGTIPSAVIQNNTCVNSGIQTDGYATLITGNDVSGWKFGTGIFTAFDTASGPSSVDCIISNNKMHDTVAGTDVNNTAFGGLENNCINALVVGNKAWNLGGAGFYNYANGATYIGNTAWDNGKNGTGGSGGVLDTAGFSVSKSPGTTQASSNNVTYISNTAFDDGAGTQSYGYAEEAGGNTFSSTVNANNFQGVIQGMLTSGPPGSYNAVNASNITSGTLSNSRLSAVPLTALATQAASTIVCNSAGSAQTPAACGALPSGVTTSGGSAPVGVSDVQTLTNKTISGASNTLSNVAQASLSIDLGNYFAANGGAYNGATDCSAALNAAITAISTSVATLQISGACAFASSISIPANIVVQFLSPGELEPATTKTITILGAVVAPPSALIFGGAGTIAFTGNNVQHIFYPNWWGAVCNASTNDYAALQAANVAANAVQGTVQIVGGACLFTSTLNLLNNVTWQGQGKNFAAGLQPSGSAQIAILGSQNTGGTAFRIMLRNMLISAGSTSAGAAVNVEAAYNIELDDVFINGMGTTSGNTQGIYTYNCNQCVTRNITIYAPASGPGAGAGDGIYHDQGSIFHDITPDLESLAYGILVTGVGTSGDVYTLYTERGGGIYVNARTGAGSLDVFGGYTSVPNTSYNGLYSDATSTNVNVFGTYFGSVSGHGLVSAASGAGQNLNVYNVPVAQITDSGKTFNQFGSAGNILNSTLTANGAIISGSATFTLSTGTGACATSSTLTGGVQGGSFLCTGTAGASTQIITLPTAPNGWACSASDITSGVAWAQSATGTTSCKVSGAIATTSDKVVFHALAY